MLQTTLVNVLKVKKTRFLSNNLLELNKVITTTKTNRVKIFTNVKLVIEKSKQNDLIENNKMLKLLLF